MALMPMIGKGKMLRSWGGNNDMTMDGSPIIDKSPIENFFIDCGWCPPSRHLAREVRMPIALLFSDEWMPPIAVRTTFIHLPLALATAAEAFGPEGAPELGLEAGHGLVFVVDVISIKPPAVPPLIILPASR